MSEQLDAYNGIRKEWEINPVTRVKKSKKKPKRLNSNQLMQEYLNTIEEEQEIEEELNALEEDE